MIFRRFLTDRSGVAATEMALISPLLMLLMCGSLELGHYFWTQHVLTKSVRDGARFAARQSFTLFDCSTNAISTDTLDQYVDADGNNLTLTQAVQLIAVYGNFSGDTPKVRNWATAEVDVTMTCPTLAVDESGDSAVTTGIYNGMANAPIVTVSANDVAYPSIFESLGLIDSNVEMNAASQAAVMGI